MVPERPADVAGRGRVGPRAGHHGEGAAGPQECQRDEHGKRREPPHHDQRHHEQVHGHDDGAVERPGAALTKDYRQRPLAVISIEVGLVDVLAHQDRHHP